MEPVLRSPRQRQPVKAGSSPSSNNNKLPSLRIDTSNSTNKKQKKQSSKKQYPSTNGSGNNSHSVKINHPQKKVIVQSHIEDFQPDLNLDEFLEEIDMKQRKEEKLTENKDGARGYLKNAVNLTSVLLDTRKALRSDYNIVETDAKNVDRVGSPIQASTSGNSFNTYDSDNVYKSPLKISRATRARAEKVNLMFRFHYLIIERYYEKYCSYQSHSNLDDAENKDERSYYPVDCTYNPLQTIRNRDLRNKYHEYPKQLSIKTIPLASNMFSSHNEKYSEEALHHHRHHIRRKDDKPWKMLWAVELIERYSDMAWQHLHWHELVKSNGELWFPDKPHLLQLPGPDATSSHKDQQSHLYKNVRRRLHDKLFNSEEEDKSALTSRRNSLLGAGSIGDYHITNLKHSIKHRRRSNKKNSIPSDYEENANASATNIPSLLKERLFRKAPKASDSSNESNVEQSQQQEYFSGEDESDEVSLFENLPPRSEEQSQYNSIDGREQDSAYVILQDVDEDELRGIYDDLESSNSVEVANVKDVPIKAVRSPYLNGTLGNNEKGSKIYEEIDELLGGEEEVKLDDGQAVQEIEETEDEKAQEDIEVVNCKEIELERDTVLNSIVFNYKYLDSLLNIRSHYVGNIFPQLLRNHHSKVVHLANVEIPKATHISVKVNDELLPAYEGIYNGLLNDINSLIHHINEDYSIRIDNLLSSSDRLIGEINTSLSLELRKFNEKIDRLNSSLFGSRFNFEMNDHKDKILKMNNNNNQILYSFIENMIIILLRLIWIVVNCYKIIRAVVMFLYRVIRLFTG